MMVMSDDELSDFANKVQRWSFRCARRPSISEVADHFKVSPSLVIDAVRYHYWMALETVDGRLIDGDLDIDDGIPLPSIDDYTSVFIYHEGE